MYQGTSGGLLKLIKSIDIPAFLDGTSKTLNVINQAIPVFYQVKPLMSNIGTIFKISNAINSNDNSTDKKEVIKEAIPKNNNSPIFYI